MLKLQNSKTATDVYTWPKVKKRTDQIWYERRLLFRIKRKQFKRQY